MAALSSDAGPASSRAEGTTRPIWPLLTALALSVGNLLLHKPISDVCDWARAQWGFPRYDRVALVGIPILTVVALVPLVARRRRILGQPARRWVLLSLLVMSLGAQRWLLVANIELIHFPQFALIAALLLAAGWSGEAAWVAATAAGIVDETYQQYVIYADRTDTYLDFNDMVLNAIGASCAVALLGDVGASGSSLNTRPTRPNVPNLLRWPRVVVLLALLLPVIVWLDPPRFVPFLGATLAGHLYRVISAGEAWLWGGLLWGLTVLAVEDPFHLALRPDGERSSAPPGAEGRGL